MRAVARRRTLHRAKLSYQATVLADSPGVFFRYKDGAGTNAADTSGNGHAGTFTAAPTWNNTGPISSDLTSRSITPTAGARLFIPSAPWMYDAAFRAGSSESWFKTNASGALYTLMERRQSPVPGTNELFVHWVRGDLGHQIQGIVWSQLQSTSVVLNGPAVNDNAWHHTVLTWLTDFGANSTTARLYLDGVQVDAGTFNDKATADVAELTCTAENDNSRTFVGSVAEQAYYPIGALSAARVAAHFAAAA